MLASCPIPCRKGEVLYAFNPLGRHAACTAFARMLYLAAALLACSAVQAQSPPETDVSESRAPTPDGLVFDCPQENMERLRQDIEGYLQSEDIAPQAYRTTVDGARGWLQLQLQDARSTSNTLHLIQRPEFELREALVTLPAARGRQRVVLTTSKKEILLALMQQGRQTRFGGKACNLQALVDEVGVRQNTVAWAASVSWIWPNGGPAHWNTRYWKRGDLVNRRKLREAVMDAFLQPQRYAIGCYTATKLVIVQGQLDYFARVRPDPKKLKALENRLMRDGDPLTAIEPGRMWYFEADATAQDLQQEGKITRLIDDVDITNFVPGDWVYFLNTDPVSYAKTGYEGSNAIYLGRGKFDDYYNDNNHAYTYAEKLQEVYQWRNGVFSRSHDLAKTHLLTTGEIRALGKTPQDGGLQLPYRAVPWLPEY